MRNGRGQGGRGALRAAARTLEQARPGISIEEATQNTRAVVRVVEALGAANTAVEAVQAALDTVRDAFGWAYGSYWILDRGENALRFSAQSGTVTEEFQNVTREAPNYQRNG